MDLLSLDSVEFMEVRVFRFGEGQGVTVGLVACVTCTAWQQLLTLDSVDFTAVRLAVALSTGVCWHAGCALFVSGVSS